MAASLWEVCDLTDDVVQVMLKSFCRNFHWADHPEWQTDGFDRCTQVKDLTCVQRYRDSYMNHVIRIRLNPALGFILKLAPPRMQCPGLSLEAPVDRGHNEFRALHYFLNTQADCVPLPVFYDQDVHILCTLELSGFHSLAEDILQGHYSEIGARAFGAKLAAIHSASHVLCVGHKGLLELLQQYPTLDAMVSLIRIFHYERPFMAQDSTEKRCAPEVKPFLSELYADACVMAMVEKVKKMFVEDKECFIHGDLHIDSVIVKQDDYKMVDAEFSRVGPCAYDMGLLLATLLLLYHHQRYMSSVEAVPQKPKTDTITAYRQLNLGSIESHLHRREPAEDHSTKNESRLWMGSQGDVRGNEEVTTNQPNHRIGAEGVLNICFVMMEEYISQVTERLKQDHVFSQKLLHDIAAFCACELLSCIIGPSHFDFMDESSQAQLDGVKSALRILREVDSIKTVADFLQLTSLKSHLSSKT